MNLNVKHKTCKEKKIEKFQYLGQDKEILDLTTRKTDKSDIIKSRNFCSKETLAKGMKRQATDWKKKLQVIYVTKDSCRTPTSTIDN